MKKIYGLSAFIVIVSSGIAYADITFGSEHSGFVLVDGTGLEFSSAATLSGGLIRDRVGNAISAPSSLACSNMTFDVIGEDEVEPYTVKCNGTVVPGDRITLGDDQKITLLGGRIIEEITIAGSSTHPSMIDGYGELDNTVIMENNSALCVRWNGQFNQNIAMTATNASRVDIIDDVPTFVAADTCQVYLNQDLEFAPERFLVPSGDGDCSVYCFNNANQYKLIMGGTLSSDLVIDHDFHIYDPCVRLSGPVYISNTKTLYIHGGSLEGAGNSVKFGAIYSFLNNGDDDVTVSNVVFDGITPNSLRGEGNWNFLQCYMKSNAYSWYVNEGLSLDLLATSFDITGMLTNTNSELFVGYARFAAATNNELLISLNTDLVLYGHWRFDDMPTIKGNGHTITLATVEQEVEPDVFTVVKQGFFGLGTSVLRFENVTLANIKGVSFNTSVNELYHTLQLQEVTWVSSDGTKIFITGLNGDAAELELVANTDDSAGDIFSTAVTWANSARIELLGDTTLAAAWRFEGDTTIDGRGAALDVSSGIFRIAPENTLTLRNIVLRNVSGGLFEHTLGNTGAVRLSNVTIELAGDATWTKDIRAEGPVTVITGSHTLIGLNIEVGTALYDTLGGADSNNLQVWAGQTLHLGSVGGGGSDYDPETTGTIIINGNTALEKNEYLFPDDELDGRNILCTGSGVYNGHGRSLVFPQTRGFDTGAAKVITVDTGQTLLVTDMILDKLVPSEHLEVNGSLYFGDNTIIRLNQDVTLESALYFGSNDSGAHDVYAELDLGGQCLDLGSTGWIELAGAEDADNVLAIKNGRIIVRDSDQLIVAQNGNLLLFENVEIILLSNWLHDVGALAFQGACCITGAEGSTVRMTSTDAIAIREGSVLTLTDGIVYSHGSPAGFNFADSTSCLELIGATFRHPDYVRGVAAENLELSVGTFLCDHKSYIQPGSGGMSLAANLTVQLRPGATIIVNEAHSESPEDTSAGTLTYGSLV